MEEKEYFAIAQDLFREAYEHQMEGEFETAIELYQQSILAYPTAEAHTYLAWTLSEQGKLDEAIEECKKAISIDPEFGNAYNDIGSYLIEKLQHEEAIPWLMQAIQAKRYDHPHYAHCNLGHSYVGLEMYNKAREEYAEALKLDPDYRPAREGLRYVKMLIQ